MSEQSGPNHSDGPTKPSEAYASGKCPMCLGTGTTHKFVPTEGESACSGCGGSGLLADMLTRLDADSAQ